MNTKEKNRVIDELVDVDTQIKAFEKRKGELKEVVIAFGEGAHASKHGSISITTQNRRTLSSEKMKAEIPAEFLEKFYVESKSVVVRVTKFEVNNG